MAGGLSMALPAMPSLLAKEERFPIRRMPPLQGGALFHIKEDFDLLDVFWKLPYGKYSMRDFDRFAKGYTLVDVFEAKHYILFEGPTLHIPSMERWRGLPKPVIGYRARIPAKSAVIIWNYMEPPLVKGAQFILQGTTARDFMAWQYASNLESFP
jgi:hypothetical protein